ncbi:FXSXX-COOH protein [Streptomyces sp. A1136]|nr:FXSXX-COOH protein [Streptomyces sp. A1136]
MSRLPIRCGRVKSTIDTSGSAGAAPLPISHDLPEDGVVNTSATPTTSTVKTPLVPLDRIDVHSASAAETLGRVLPSENGRHVQAPMFNSAL